MRAEINLCENRRVPGVSCGEHEPAGAFFVAPPKLMRVIRVSPPGPCEETF